MLAVIYPSKKALKESIGQPLRYIETSIFGAEYQRTGRLTVAGPPHLSSVVKREFYAIISMKDGLIQKVE